ncbi:hypothetical protein Q0590_34250 [Rhodocytophaga aerolata]|uniref:Uncharacterized protein n=1 Tax=Rhodocytophaga aerolata TaxID=455078 RepID=A0ABT8RJG6_9BACT|nr:hypothetical protein [Rhodocytophaga aerolata]MDO1451388.1 hypothetical protein [Rhodocytophaga aerolata]
MNVLVFAAMVVSLDILLIGIVAVYTSRWVNEWMSRKEETYLFGQQGKESGEWNQAE